jgi:hypothetical protein
VVLGVAVALLRARAARRYAGLEHAHRGAALRVGLAANDSTDGTAGVGAVEAATNAAFQLADVVLAEAGVGADGARRRAGRAVVDAAREHRGIRDERARVRLQDRFDAHATNTGPRGGGSRAGGPIGHRLVRLR